MRKLIRRVEIMFLPEQVERIDKAAKAIGMDRSNFIRSAALEKAQAQKEDRHGK